MNLEFTDLNLQVELVQRVTELGYETPTPIQAAVIPVMLMGQDVIGQAQTGTGKTAAFALPLLQNLGPNQNWVQGLVLAPTRELAMQVAKAIYEYGQGFGVRVLAVYGGEPYHRQISRLNKGVDIVIGTPGRLLDLIGQQVLDLSQIHTLVLDEADEMLSLGFIEDIEAILSHVPAARQTALFSATIPPEIRRLAENYLHEPEFCRIETAQLTVTSITQRYYTVNEVDKLAALTRLFEVEPITRALIFVKTRQGTGELANELTVRGFPAEALNGDMSQEARTQVLNRFRHNQLKVLVATDVAARGLDIDDISHVFNFDLPPDAETYVHRVGRTGRAGKTGVAVSLTTPKEQWHLRRIERYTKQGITQSNLPSVEDIQHYRESQLIDQVLMWLQRGRCRREQEIVMGLVEAGYEPLELAAVALKMARAEEKQRPIAPIGEVIPWEPKDKGGRNNRRERRGHGDSAVEKGMVRLTLDRGKTDDLRVNHIVGTIARQADIPGNSLGRIRLQDDQTFIDVPEQFVERVLAKPIYRMGKHKVRVTR